MPKPNFVKKPIEKIMDMKLKDLPNKISTPTKEEKAPLFGRRPKAIIFDDYDLEQQLEEADLHDLLRDLGDKD